MATVKGTGVVFSTGAVGGIVTHLPQSVDCSKVAQKTQIKDNGGSIRVNVYHGFEKTLSLSIVPQGSTIANAQTAMDTGMYEAGTSLTITDSIGTIIDGVYNVDAVTQRRTVDGHAILDLQLSRGDETGIDTTTLVS